MRIAITHAYGWPEVRRGAERIVRETARALACRGHDVTTISSAWKALEPIDQCVRSVRLRRLRRSRAGHERDFGLRLVPQLAARRFDVVHALGVRDAAAAVRAARVRRGTRTVYENLGVPIRSWWERQPEADDHRLLVRDVDVYGCMSQFALDALKHEYGRDGSLIPGGVDLARFTPAPERERRPTILFSGALTEERKGVAVLLEAIALLARDEPDVRLWLSGPGDPAQLLANAPAAARERTEVLGLGDADRQQERYGRAWVTALPSTDDSFGMVLIESLACGTPVVGGDHSAVPELVKPGAGVLCTPGDAGSVASACAQALELARDRHTEEHCREVARPYDWQTGIVPLLERLYER